MRSSLERRSRSSRNSVLEDAYPPDPEDADKRKSVLQGVAGYIIVTEFCERLAYYGFAGSLVLFFQTQLGMTNAEADVQYSAWMGMCYVTPLIGGYIADTYLGRYYAILVRLTYIHTYGTYTVYCTHIAHYHHNTIAVVD